MPIKSDHRAPNLTGAHEFYITEMRVYPTERPDKAREIPVEPQMIKLNAIARTAIERAILTKIGMLGY